MSSRGDPGTASCRAGAATQRSGHLQLRGRFGPRENIVHYLTGLGSGAFWPHQSLWQAPDMNANMIVEYDNGANARMVFAGRLRNLTAWRCDIRQSGLAGVAAALPDSVALPPRAARPRRSAGARIHRRGRHRNYRQPSGIPKGCMSASRTSTELHHLGDQNEERPALTETIWTFPARTA
jgi:hypothetical protein